jgi:SAM-dependent methyltransferase
MAQGSETSNAKRSPPYARILAPLIRPFPNFDIIFVQSLRREAVQLLRLGAGDRVIDAGCGPGGSFEYLVDAIGPTGELVGVEISPEFARLAQRRIEKNHWSNVHIAQSAAENVRLEGTFDALLMLGAPDVYGSPESLGNLLPYLNDGARVVAFGAKLKRSAGGRVLNLVFRFAFSKLTFASTPALNHEPWALLQESASDLQVQDKFFGWMFLAFGSIDKGAKR